MVVAAGERWPNGSLRPAAEDLWGAGAVLHTLGIDDASPEARLAATAYAGVRDDLPSALTECAGGRELIEDGFPRDVEIASAVDVSEVVPLLRGEAFVDGQSLSS
jgi:2-phosphosulfolactate phosphatase